MLDNTVRAEKKQDKGNYDKKSLKNENIVLFLFFIILNNGLGTGAPFGK